MAEIPSFQAYAIPDVPMIQMGDDLPQIFLNVLSGAGFELQAGDILVIASKIVSKSQGCIVPLADVEPSQEALELAEQTDKDPRLVELILQESIMVSRMKKGVLVTEHRLGFVSANSGIDQSNIDETQSKVLLLPSDPDQSARDIRENLKQITGHEIAIVITDTHGRPFRLGNTGVAIGVAGMQALLDSRGEHDLFGRELVATILGYADLLASAAHLVMGEGAEGRPLVLIRGLAYPKGNGQASDLNRPREEDLYR
jgi:coenzyme F420-0:L-glutamate ligase / coenzyme F420-1:gamma-L-glutamate ligase